MRPWFEGSTEINCDLELVKSSLGDLGAHFRGVVRSMPGISEAELLGEDEGVVTIRTNEGLMTRRNIERTDAPDRVAVRYDEVYEAGRVTARTHFEDEYSATDSGVRLQVVVSDVRAEGFTGFLYRTFGSRSMGKAFLSSQKAYLEGERG